MTCPEKSKYILWLLSQYREFINKDTVVADAYLSDVEQKIANEYQTQREYVIHLDFEKDENSKNTSTPDTFKNVTPHFEKKMLMGITLLAV